MYSRNKIYWFKPLTLTNKLDILNLGVALCFNGMNIWPKYNEYPSKASKCRADTKYKNNGTTIGIIKYMQT